MAEMTVARLDCLADHEVDDSLPRTQIPAVKDWINRES